MSSPAVAGLLGALTPAVVGAERYRKRFAAFAAAAWRVVEPKTPFSHNWHHDAIAEHLQAVSAGQIRRLIISVCPRSSKSTYTSVLWPAWDWIQAPHRRWLFGAYGLDLAIRDAVASRRLMDSEWYRERWGCKCGPRPGAHADWCEGWRFSGDQNVKSHYQNDRGGQRLSASVEAGTTGQGGDILVLDDPIDIRRAASEATRRAAISYVDQVWAGRKNDPATSAEVVIAQRTHEQDVTGHLLAQGGWEHLCLPTECEPRRRTVTVLGWQDPRTQPGELLWPARFGPEVIAAAKVRLGTYGYSAQHQQAPAPAEGGYLKRQFARFWYPPSAGPMPTVQDRDGHSYVTMPGPEAWDDELISVDASLKDESLQIKRGDPPDPVSMGVIARRGPDCYLVRRINETMDVVATCNNLMRLSREHPKAVRKLIEDKANGPAVMALLRRRVPGLTLVTPMGSKSTRVVSTAATGDAERDARAMSMQALWEAGNIWLMHPSLDPAVWDVLAQLCAFPMGTHDDDVDMLSQAIAKLEPWIWHEQDRAQREAQRWLDDWAGPPPQTTEELHRHRLWKEARRQEREAKRASRGNVFDPYGRR